MSYQELAIHTYTTKPWSITECIENYAKKGVGGISIWRETVAGHDLSQVSQHLKDAGVKPVAHVRGGFFTGLTQADRDLAHQKNLETIKEAEALGCPQIVLVCGATVGQTPQTNFEQIVEGLAKMADVAKEAGILLSVEPLHPMYAGDRSAICNMKTANDLCERVARPNVGVALDVFHVWWDVDLEAETRRCAENGWLIGYHICDFKPEMDHLLLDRGLMGEGCIPLKEIDNLMTDVGFKGHKEVEVFSRKWWSENQHDYLNTILETYDRIYRS